MTELVTISVYYLLIWQLLNLALALFVALKKDSGIVLLLLLLCSITGCFIFSVLEGASLYEESMFLGIHLLITLIGIRRRKEHEL